LLPRDPRPPQPSSEALAHSQALERSIAREIQAAGGWVDFARYMERALYAPGQGYYTGGASKFGGEGDFVTAPELSPLFAATLARQVAEILAQAPGDVLELGAGSGRMAADLLRALDDLGQLPPRYRILEPSAGLRARQEARVAQLPAPLARRVEWLERLPDGLRGAVLANEVLDALPVHLVAWREDGIFERGVTAPEGRFEFEDRPLPDGALRAHAQRIAPPAPYVSEIALAAPALVRSLAERLAQGVLLFIDYGFGEAEYYHPQRTRGTLMCHYRHRAHDDPFFLPGLQDITCHVNFSAAARAGVETGLALLGYTTQSHFLINLGITDLLARTPAEQAARYLPRAAQAQRLLSPSEMGESFKAIALGRGVGLGLTGFARGDLGRLL
jgi:SAM-dependent MidA family methyltransferase